MAAHGGRCPVRALAHAPAGALAHVAPRRLRLNAPAATWVSAARDVAARLGYHRGDGTAVHLAADGLRGARSVGGDPPRRDPRRSRRTRGSSTSATRSASSRSATARCCSGARCRTCRSGSTSRSSIRASGRSAGPIAIRAARGDVLIGPDNGLLHGRRGAARRDRRRPRLLEAAAYRLPVVSTSFHGRDIFAPAAAHLAPAWTPSSARAGDRSGDARRRRRSRARSSSRAASAASIVYVDTFGNVKLGAACAATSRQAIGPAPAGRPRSRLAPSGRRGDRATSRGAARSASRDRASCCCTRTRTGGSASPQNQGDAAGRLGLVEDRAVDDPPGLISERTRSGFSGTLRRHIVGIDEEITAMRSALTVIGSSCSQRSLVAACSTGGGASPSRQRRAASAPRRRLERAASSRPERRRRRLRQGQPDHEDRRQADDRHRQPGLPAVLPDPATAPRPRRGSSATRRTARASRARSPTRSPTSSASPRTTSPGSSSRSTTRSRPGAKDVRHRHQPGLVHAGAGRGGRPVRRLLHAQPVGRRARRTTPIASAKTVADLKAFKFGAQVGTTSLDTINERHRADGRGDGLQHQRRRDRRRSRRSRSTAWSSTCRPRST